MKKIIALLVVAVSCFGVCGAEAGYYRTKNSFTGGYASTGRTNNLGTHRAPNGYHTNSFGHVERNSLF